MTNPSTPSTLAPPEGVWVEQRLDGLQVRLPTAERSLLILAMRLFVKSGKTAAFVAGLFFSPWIFTLIEGSPLGTLYGGVTMASLVAGLCLFLNLLSLWLLHAVAEKIIADLQLRLYPTALIISPHELSLRRSLQPAQMIPSVALRGVRQAADGRCLEVFLDDGSAVAIGRDQAPEILTWLEQQLRAHISSLRDRQGAAAEVPRALQDLRQ